MQTILEPCICTKSFWYYKGHRWGKQSPSQDWFSKLTEILRKWKGSHCLNAIEIKTDCCILVIPILHLMSLVVYYLNCTISSKSPNSKF